MTAQLRFRQHGRGLVELLLATSLSLFLVIGAVTLYSGLSGRLQADTRIARMQDEGRFALGLLRRELAMAGHFDALPSSAIEIDPGLRLRGDCGTAARPWALAIREPAIRVIDNSHPPLPDCLDPGRLVKGSDLIGLRRADSAARGAAQAGRLYLRSNGVRGVLHALGAGDSFPGVPNPTDGARREFRYRPAWYYLQDHARRPGDRIPSLCRKRLAGLGFRRQCLAWGIEDLQIEFGTDADGDGIADRFRPAAAGRTVLAVRLWVLARTQDPVRREGRDEGHYRLSNSRALRRNPPLDRHRRSVYTTTVVIANRDHGLR